MPSVESPSSSYLRSVLLLVAGVLVFRLLYAALFASSPAGDEAYYWDWGRRPDIGYYSKPPFIAWLYAFVDWIGGGSLFGIRAMAAALGTLSLLLYFRFVSELFDERTAWVAVLLGVAAPANAVLSFFLTIDAPLAVCWTTALWMFWRFVTGQAGTGSLALLFAALSVGHLCKQMMMVFPLIALLFLAASSETRPLLRRVPLWAALFGSYVSLIPPLVWNARHDWITFRHTSHHFEVSDEGGNAILERLGDFLSFVGTQFGVLSPGTAFIVLSLSLAGIPLLGKAPRNHRFLLFFGALPLAVMLLLALRQELQPNWAAVFYLSGVALAAAWYSGAVPAPFPPASWRKLLPATLAAGVLLSGYFYLAPPVFAALGKSGHIADPDRRQVGVADFVAGFQRVRETNGTTRSAFVFTIGHRDYASYLAFGLPDQPRVYSLNPNPGIDSQYEIWNNPLEDGLTGRDALILVPDLRHLPTRFARSFERTEKIDEFAVPFKGEPEKRFAVYLGHGLKTWPE